jgi:hypothetical protein
LFAQPMAALLHIIMLSSEQKWNSMSSTIPGPGIKAGNKLGQMHVLITITFLPVGLLDNKQAGAEGECPLRSVTFLACSLALHQPVSCLHGSS